MEKKRFIGAIAILLSSCFLVSSIVKADESPSIEDGSSIQKAITIKYIGDHSESIGQEYEYIENNFGNRGIDWVLIEQKMVSENDKFYDVLTIKIAASGEEKTLYFDITEPFLELQKQFQH